MTIRMASILRFCFAVLLSSFFATAIGASDSSAAAAAAAATKREGSVVRLTLDNYEAVMNASDSDDSHRYGVVFVKFFAPWCSHSKKLKRDWDRLAETARSDKGLLVAEVDCTDGIAGGGKALCQRFGIESFPTLRYGAPTDPPRSFEDYNGKRTHAHLLAFCRRVLLPMLCSPLAEAAAAAGAGASRPPRDGCAERKTESEDRDRDTAEGDYYASLSIDQLRVAIRSHEEQLEAAERNFRREVRRLTGEHEVAKETKRSAVEKVLLSDGELELARQTLAMLRKQENNPRPVSGDKDRPRQKRSDEL